MTADQALHNFFSGFGIPAYPSTAVPVRDVTKCPYLTYTPVSGNWCETMSITVNLWYLTESEAVPNRKADELAQAIGESGVLLRCEGGGIWLKRGTPWCQSIPDATNEAIKCRYINVSAEFLLMR